MNTFVSSTRLAGAALAAVLAAQSIAAATTVLSTPVGVIAESAPAGPSGYAFPLIDADVVVGTVVSNTGSSIVLADATGAVGARLAPERRYFVEITTGPLEGERLDLDTAATIAAGGPGLVVEFGEITHSTLPSLADGALAGARCVVRPHLTLADLPGMFTPALRGHRFAIRADAVVFVGEEGVERYSLAEDNQTWLSASDHRLGPWALLHHAWRRRHAQGAPTDYAALVIPPDVSVMIENNSGPKVWRHEGIVRSSAFRKNLGRGVQAFASGFPVDLAPLEIGAFVDTAEPAAVRWTGSNLFLLADQIEVLLGDQGLLALYYLRGDGRTWRELGGSARVDHAGRPILGATDMILLRRRNADSGFIVPRPFDL